MTSLNLWRAEWLKTRKRPANIGILILMVVIIVIGLAGITGLALWNGDPDANLVQEARSVLPFPHAMLFPLNLLTLLGVLLSAVFVANTIGSEYSRDTWKMILPRQGSRLRFLTAKLVVGAFALVLFLLSMMLIAQLVGWIGAAVVGIELVQANPGAVFQASSGMIFGIVRDMVFYGCFAFLTTILARSTIFGIISTFIASVLLSGISFISAYLAMGLPAMHLLNLQAHWGAGDPELTMVTEMAFKRSLPVGVSVAVVLGYMALFIGGACLVFKRRDMAGG